MYPTDVLAKSLDNVHGRFLVALAIRRQAKLPFGKNELELLGPHLYWTALAEQTIERDPTLIPSQLHPGYYKGVVNDSAIFVPWYLADVFPGLEIAQNIERLARRLQVDPKGSICLSGSGVFRGVVSAIGDIDFCEYAISNPTEIPGFINEMILRGNDAPLVRMYLPGAKPAVNFFAPWEPSLTKLTARYQTKESAGAPILVFEHIVSNVVLGVLPCTNRLHPVERDRAAEGHGKKTFAFQEAVFASGDSPPPRSLVAPYELGDYVAWLRDQIRPEADGDGNQKLSSIKRLKRAFSLARCIHLDDLAKEALAILNDPLVKQSVRRATAKQLRRLIKYLPSEEQHVWRRSLDEAIPKIELGEAKQLEIDLRADKVVSRIGESFDYIADQILKVSYAPSVESVQNSRAAGPP